MFRLDGHDVQRHGGFAVQTFISNTYDGCWKVEPNVPRLIHAMLPKLDEFIDSISKRNGETVQGDLAPSCRHPEFDNIADWSGWGSMGTPEHWGHHRRLV